MTAPPLAAGRAEVFRALGVLAEPPGPEHAALARLLDLPAPGGTEWTETFLVQLVPHASVYLDAEGMLGGEAADRIAGFWRALRLPVPADPDHLSALLGLYASLLEAEQTEPDGPRRVLWHEARGALLHEHLLSWLLPYTHAMADVAPAAYADWSRLLREALLAESAAVGLPGRLPLHLQAVPPPADGSDGLDPLVAGLLSPIRSGVVITRGHLGRAAGQLGLGLRMGDRRQMLRGLLTQDPHRVLGGLAELAQTWAARHRADAALVGDVATYWADRASATEGQLRLYTTSTKETRP